MYKDFVKTVRGIRNSAGCKTYDALFHQTTPGGGNAKMEPASSMEMRINSILAFHVLI